MLTRADPKKGDDGIEILINDSYELQDNVVAMTSSQELAIDTEYTFDSTRYMLLKASFLTPTRVT